MRCSQSILLVWFLLGFYLLLSRVCQLFEGRSQSVHSRIPGTGWGQHTPVEEETSVWDGWPLCLAPVLSSRFSTGRPTPSTPPCNVHPRHEPLSLQIPDTHPPTHIFTHVYPMLLSPSSWLLKAPTHQCCTTAGNQASKSESRFSDCLKKDAVTSALSICVAHQGVCTGMWTCFVRGRKSLVTVVCVPVGPHQRKAPWGCLLLICSASPTVEGSQPWRLIPSQSQDEYLQPQLASPSHEELWGPTLFLLLRPVLSAKKEEGSEFSLFLYVHSEVDSFLYVHGVE